MRGATLLALVAALAPACGRAVPPAREARLHLESEPPHLNPLLAGDALAVRVTLGDVYEPLWSVDPATDALVPALAETWWRSPDDRRWIVTLRGGVVWHDGHPFSADDVVSTWRLLRDGAPSPLAADFDDAEVTARDPRTVEFHFGRFRVGRDRNVARIPILPAHLLRATPPADLLSHPISRAPVGTGPFAFEAWDAGEAIRLRRWPRWWGPAPAVDRLVWRIVPDRDQALAQLQAGRLDAIFQVRAADAAALAGDRFEVVEVDAQSFTAVTWNCRREPLSRPEVRRALTMLLDRDTVIREIYKGRARPISGPWVPIAPAYDPLIAPLPFDPDAASALLAAARVLAPRVTILIPAESRSVERITSIWQDDAGRAGVAMVVEAVPWAELLRRARAGDFDGVVHSWTTAPEQDFFQHFHTGQSENHGAISDPELDRLLETIQITDQRAPRLALEHQLHRRLHDLQPLTFISSDVRTAVLSRRLDSFLRDRLLP